MKKRGKVDMDGLDRFIRVMRKQREKIRLVDYFVMKNLF